MDIKLSYGLREGRIVHINEITPDLNGKRCGCVCPACRRNLIARSLGKKRIAHFAHEGGSSCGDRNAQQTALHILAKEVILEGTEILVPGWKIEKEDLYDGLPNRKILSEAYDSISKDEDIRLKMESTKRPYQAEGIEKSYGDFIPDAVINIKGNECLVEILVTHAVDEKKAEKVRRQGLPMFEIDLSAHKDSGPTREEVKRAVLETASRKWINNPKKDSALIKATAEINKAYEDIEDRLRKEEEQRREEARKRQEEAKEAERAAVDQPSPMYVKRLSPQIVVSAPKARGPKIDIMLGYTNKATPVKSQPKKGGYTKPTRRKGR